MDQVEWAKVLDARDPWVGVQNRITTEWPEWVDRLDLELQLWLAGESVVQAEFGFDAGEDGYADTAYESSRLWGVILSTRYVVWIEVRKLVDTERGTATVKVVRRSAITDLRVEVSRVHPAYGRGFVTVAEFEGIPTAVRIPADPEPWYTLTVDERTAIFLSLREDLLRDR